MTTQRAAEAILGPIDWQSPTVGYCKCPGKDLHTGANGKRDCKVMLDGAPTVSCFHDSCRSEVDRVNLELRRALSTKGSRTNCTPMAPRYTTPAAAASPARQSAQRRYDLRAATGTELPEAIPDGARELIRACFEPGEGVRIVRAKINDEGKEVPDGEGPCLSREEWLRKLDAKKGDPNGIFSSTKKSPPGIYITVNPMRVGGSKDDDVTDFRRCLVEFDHGCSEEEQWLLYQQSKLPCAAIILSGGKSVHAWVKVDARDRREYDERVALIYKHFEAYGLDEKNKNPSRLSRLPNCVRFDRRQQLLALNTGAESFAAWAADVQAEGIGQTFTFRQVFDYLPDDDGKTLVGQRWLRRGGSCLLVGPSGVGKSSLVLQMVIAWALGRPAFGITPERPLRVLVVQAENDEADMHEMITGVCAGLEVAFDSAAQSMLESNLVLNRNVSHTGFAFTEALRRLIEKHHPDLVVLDPLLSFIGADISRQEVCSEFLRNWLNPISDATGVAWLCVHHTGKPPSDKDARKGWQGSDWSYVGIGSSELTNWTRAAMVLRDIGHGRFMLKLTKRGKRAGATHPDGTPDTDIWLQHASTGIFWTQIEPPEREDEPDQPAKEKPLSPAMSVATSNLHEFLSACTDEGEGLREIARRLEDFSATTLKIVVSESLCTSKIVPLLVKNGKLKKSNKRFMKGENA